jgi:hypothetical protein
VYGRCHISFAFRGVKTTLPANMRGWDTGTLEVNDVSFAIDNNKTNLFEAKAARLRVVTSEKVEVLPKKESNIRGNTLQWDMDQLRLPVYSRYQSSVIFEIGKTGGLLAPLGVGVEPDAIAVLWMQDLTDDVEQEVKIPVLVAGEGQKRKGHGKNKVGGLANLRQNAINDFTAKYHDFEIVGWLTARMRLDSGLDEDHEVSLVLRIGEVILELMGGFQKLDLSQSRRHALEA